MTRTLISGRRLSLEFKPQDLWVGAFWTDTDLWVCVLPCLPLHWRKKPHQQDQHQEGGGVSEYSRDDLLDTIEDLLGQCCGLPNGDIDHVFMSTYEDACDLLAACRPEQWQPTRHGLRRINEERV